MVQMMIFWSQKMVLHLVFDGFSCISIVYIVQNLKIPDMYRIFENIRQKRAKIEFEAYIIHFLKNEGKNQKSNCNIFFQPFSL